MYIWGFPDKMATRDRAWKREDRERRRPGANCRHSPKPKRTKKWGEIQQIIINLGKAEKQGEPIGEGNGNLKIGSIVDTEP